MPSVRDFGPLVLSIMANFLFLSVLGVLHHLCGAIVSILMKYISGILIWRPKAMTKTYGFARVGGGHGIGTVAYDGAAVVREPRHRRNAFKAVCFRIYDPKRAFVVRVARLGPVAQIVELIKGDESRHLVLNPDRIQGIDPTALKMCIFRASQIASLTGHVGGE